MYRAPATLDGEELGAEGEEQVAAEDRTASAIRAVRESNTGSSSSLPHGQAGGGEEDRLAMFSVYRDLHLPGASLSVAAYLVSAPILVDQVFLPQVQALCFLVLPGQEELQRQQVDAAEAQAPLGFLEVPIISSWVRGGTENYDNIVAKMYPTRPTRNVHATHPDVGCVGAFRLWCRRCAREHPMTMPLTRIAKLPAHVGQLAMILHECILAGFVPTWLRTHVVVVVVVLVCGGVGSHWRSLNGGTEKCTQSDICVFQHHASTKHDNMWRECEA